MVIQLSNGKYLHTAYAVSNIAEEFEAEDWSLSSQEGYGYIGTYIDGSVVDSSDPTDYNWEEFLDTGVDDTDEDGDMPVADLQSQIDALADQIDVLQDDTSELKSNAEVNEENITGASELASEANDIANATNQHFWYDDNGAHVSTEDGNPEGERNAVWNTLGMLFRKGATNLLAILAGGETGDEAKGLAVYDGEDNGSQNVVASFTNEGATIGRADEGQVRVSRNNVQMTDSTGSVALSLEQEESSSVVTATDTLGLDTWPERSPVDHTASKKLSNPYLGNISVTIVATVWVWEGTQSRKYSYSQIATPPSSFTLAVPKADCSLTGSVSFVGDTVTVDITTIGEASTLVNPSAQITYDTNLSTPFLSLGRFADKSDKANKAFVIGQKTSAGNAFEVDRNGAVSMMANTSSTGSTFRITEETAVRPTVAGNYGSESYTHRLYGYFPLCCIGYRFEGTHSTLLNVYRVQLTSVTRGQAAVTIGTRDTASSGEGEYTVHTWVLWAKEVER